MCRKDAESFDVQKMLCKSKQCVQEFSYQRRKLLDVKTFGTLF